MLIENFPFFLRTQQLGSQKEREQSLQNSENSMFLGSQTKKSYQSLQNLVVNIFWVAIKKKARLHLDQCCALLLIRQSASSGLGARAMECTQNTPKVPECNFLSNKSNISFPFSACMVNHMWAHTQLS